MLKKIIRLLAPPLFSNDEDKTRSAGNVHWITLAFMIAILAYEIAGKIQYRSLAFNQLDAALVVIFFILAGVVVLNRNGFVRQASTTLVAILWIAVNATAFFGFGVRDSAYIANFLVLLASSLLLGWQPTLFLASLTIAAGFGLAYIELSGLAPTAYYPASPTVVMRDQTIIFLIFGLLLVLLIRGLENAITKAKAGTRELEMANRDLSAARQRLEENRNELIAANDQLKQRADKISAIANIAKTIALAQEFERLLPTVVSTISKRFDYYHVGIYLLDESKQTALLLASSSEDGLRLIRRKHRVKVSSENIVGIVTTQGSARYSQSDNSNQRKFDNTDLPRSQSQIVLPLKLRETVIGALDIHSIKTNAFSTEDIAVLQILADQVAIAIQNARSTDQARDALRKAEFSSRQMTGAAWREYTEYYDSKGFHYDGIKPDAIRDADEIREFANTLIMPVVLRGQVIGRLRLNPSELHRQWTEDEVAIAEATAERVALALEGARLLEDAQNRAQREAFLSDVSSKLGGSFQLDSILRDTVEELGHAFKNTTVSFQLVNPNKPAPTPASTDKNHTPGNGRNSS